MAKHDGEPDVDHDRTPPWAAAVLPPAFEGWTVVFQTNESIGAFAATLGMPRLRLRRLIDSGHVFLVPAPKVMRISEFAHHTGYSQKQILAMEARGELAPVERRPDGEPMFREDQLAPNPDRKPRRDRSAMDFRTRLRLSQLLRKR